MSLNETPKGERVHIALLGKRNAGKSSLVNAITNQDLAIVSDTPGTTTDPVYKAMEILPLGPVMLIDTAGLDDTGKLGETRILKTRTVLNKTDIALLVIDTTTLLKNDNDFLSIEKELISLSAKKNIPTVVVFNKLDITSRECKNEIENVKKFLLEYNNNLLFSCVSANDSESINALREMLSQIKVNDDSNNPIVRDLLEPNDLVILVIPIDSAAPKGRLILPQQQVIRDILEAGATAMIARDTELLDTLERLKKSNLLPKLVITDSQAFAKVNKLVGEDIALTSFSILMSRYKGDLQTQIDGIKALSTLKDGDIILMAEGCTHHRQCNDIGTVKIPNWLKKYTGKNLVFETSSGASFPDDLSKYALIIHCGGCTLTKKEMAFRIANAKDQNIPIVNYGTVIAEINGILKRSVAPLI